MILYVEKCKRLKGECGIEMNKKYLILFGAGKNGISALEKYGKDKGAFFCDNALEKQGAEIEGITVISFEEMLKIDVAECLKEFVFPSAMEECFSCSSFLPACDFD